MREKKPKRYNARSKVYRGLGLGTIGVTTTGGFYAYQSLTNFDEFTQNVNTLAVISEESLKLNFMFALPFLIGIVITYWVTKKKSPEFYKDKISMSLAMIIFALYLVYSIIEVSMFSLAGAFVGSVIDETIFNPMSKRAKIKAIDNKEIEMEYTKEMRRIKARKQAKDNYEGSV